MSYYYFGQDEKGCFADTEANERQYMDRELWLQIIKAGSVTPQPGMRAKLRITDEFSVDIYEGDALVKSVTLPADTTEI